VPLPLEATMTIAMSATTATPITMKTAFPRFGWKSRVSMGAAAGNESGNFGAGLGAGGP
jgi:hypothetical protein